MPRPPRLEFENAFYHAYSRGNRRESIFLSPQDYQFFEDSLLSLAMGNHIRLYAWCLMPNHFHLLIQTPDGNISLFMRRLLTRYAHYFNKAHHLVGHVFQGRYKAVLCDKEAYLLELVRYIHLNPLRVRNGSLTHSLSDWKWSSHKYFLSQKSSEIGSIREVLDLFSNDKKSARELYKQFLIDGMQRNSEEDIYQVKGNQFLGDAGFIEEAKQKSNQRIRREGKRLKRLTGIAQLFTESETLFGAGQKELQLPSQQRRLSRIRQAIIYVGRKYYRYPSHRLAVHLGRETSAVSQVIRRIECDESRIPEIVQLISHLSADKNEICQLSTTAPNPRIR